MKAVLFFFILLFFQFHSSADTPDSLLEKLSVSAGAERVTLLNQICFLKRRQDPMGAIPLLKEALDLGAKHNLKAELSKSNNLLGICYGAIGMPDSALYYYNISFDYATMLADSETMSYIYSNMGNIYRKSGNYTRALDLYLNSVKICEATGNRGGLTSAYNNIGLVYDDMGSFDLALDFYSKSLKIAYEKNDSDAVARAFSNMAIVYNEKGDPEKSLEYDLKSLELNRAMRDTASEAISLVNIGVYYYDKGDLKTALDYYNKAFQIKTRLNDKKGLANLLGNLSLIYSRMGDTGKAEQALEEALRLAVEIRVPKLQIELYLHLSELFEKTDFRKSFFYFRKYSELKDSLFNSETAKQFSDMEKKHANEKMENEIKLLTKDKELSDAEKKKNRLRMVFISFMLLLMVAFSVVVLMGYRNKQKANLKILEQSLKIEEINKEVFASIRYAKRIQDALLKEEEHVTAHLPEHFVFYKPKDIISGDFYWSLERNGVWYLAVADCTGHGVPGAMMSMLGIAFLNEICSGEKFLDPAHILDNLREKVIKELGQTGKEGDTKDGMDISLCCFDLPGNKLFWSGANNPLWIIKNQSTPGKNEEDEIDRIMTEIKGDKQPVGFFESRKSFTSHEISLQKGDCIYLFSDGFADQFGGPKGKKFKYSQLKKTLFRLRKKPMIEQKQELSGVFEEWRSGFEQIDDVCIIGVRT